MTPQAAHGTRTADDAAPRRSVGVTLLTLDGAERQARLVAISSDLERATISVQPTPALGDSLVFYVESGARFVGTCTDVEGGLATLRLRKRTNTLRRSGARVMRQDTERRATNDACTLTGPDGVTHDCQVLDVSLSGLFVATEARLAVGAVVRVGRAEAEVVRRTPTGYGMRLLRAGEAPVARPAPSQRDEAVGLAA